MRPRLVAVTLSFSSSDSLAKNPVASVFIMKTSLPSYCVFNDSSAFVFIRFREVYSTPAAINVVARVAFSFVTSGGEGGRLFFFFCPVSVYVAEACVVAFLLCWSSSCRVLRIAE